MKRSSRDILKWRAFPVCAGLLGACGTGGPGGDVAAQPYTSTEPGGDTFGSLATGNPFTSDQTGASAFTSTASGSGTFQSKAKGPGVATSVDGTGSGATGGSTGAGGTTHAAGSRGTGGTGTGLGTGTGGSTQTGSTGCASICSACTNLSASSGKTCEALCAGQSATEIAQCASQFKTLVQCFANAGKCDAIAGSGIDSDGSICPAEGLAVGQCLASGG